MGTADLRHLQGGTSPVQTVTELAPSSEKTLRTPDFPLRFSVHRRAVRHRTSQLFFLGRSHVIYIVLWRSQPQSSLASAVQLIDGYFPAPVNREIRPSETLGRAAYFFHADFDLGGGFRPPVSTCRRVRPVLPTLGSPPPRTSLDIKTRRAHEHCTPAHLLSCPGAPNSPWSLKT